MELDNLLNSLNQDLDNQLKDLEIQSNIQVSFCPECGSPVEPGTRFCANCGTQLVEDGNTNHKEASHADSMQPKLMIFTDFSALSKKFGGETSDIAAAFAQLESRIQQLDINAFVYDFSSCSSSSTENWEDYQVVMEDAITSHGWATGIDVSVVIVGGDDVIPMPRQFNPLQNCGLKKLHCDSLYCWKIPYNFDFTDGREELQVYLDADSALFSVSRIPFADGKINSDFSEILNDYFDKALKQISGIEVKSVLTTSASVWIPASKYMSRFLPSVSVSDYLPQSTLHDSVVLSPVIDMKDQETYKKYENAVVQADMLLYNLHGSDSESSSGFYGQKGDNYPIAVHPLRFNTSAKILNTCACFGGRFIGYNPTNSMLLRTLMMSDTPVVLFAGSCSTALGASGHGEPQAAYSEILLPMYIKHLMEGMPAGKAMLMAKIEYLNTLPDSSPKTALATFLMFNVYGLPTLFVKSNNSSKNYKNMENMQSSSSHVVVEKRTTLMNKSYSVETQATLLQSIRDAVDANLAAIREIVEKDLYEKLGLEAKDIESIESYTATDDKGIETSGYYFNYAKTTGPFTIKTFAKTDSKGNIISTIQTK